jgi:hypothetical protein
MVNRKSSQLRLFVFISFRMSILDCVQDYSFTVIFFYLCVDLGGTVRVNRGDYMTTHASGSAFLVPALVSVWNFLEEGMTVAYLFPPACHLFCPLPSKLRPPLSQCPLSCSLTCALLVGLVSG